MKKQLFKTAFLMVLLCAIGTSAWAATTDYTHRMSSAKDNWTNATGTYGDGGVERYNGNDNAFAAGNVLTQTINDLPNGYFEVEFYAWENFSNWNDNANIAYGNGKAQVFANASVEDIHVIKNTGGRAFDDANTYKLLALVTDGTLTYGVKNIAAGGNWAVCKPKSLTFLGAKVDDNTDLTSAINNYHFVNCENNAFPGWTISAPNGGNTQKLGDTCVEYWISSAANGNFDYYQTLSNLPAGKYKLSASMWNSTNNESGAATNGNAGVYGTSSNGTVFAGVTTDSGSDALNTYTTDGVIVTDGTLRIGVKNNGTMGARWFGVDWITLKYLGSCLVNEAETLPTTAVTKDKWYAYNIPTTDDYEIIASAATTLTYTQDGTQLTSTATGTTETFTVGQTNTIHLSTGTVYFKSSAASIISVSYKYTLNESSMTSSIAADNYVGTPTLSTFTLTYPNATTNDPNASFDIIGMPVATLKKNGSPVATSSALVANASAKTITASFSNLVLDANVNDYTINIAAGSFGYNGHAENTAISINFKTPALFDQTAFLKDNGTGLFLARGYDWGTRAYLDIYGTATLISTDNEGYTTFKFVDTDRYLGYDGSNNLYCDKAGGGDDTKWVVTLADGKYRLTGKDKTAGTNYVKYDDGDTYHLLWADGTGKSDENIVDWNLVSASDYADAMVTLKNTQASTAATATGLTATTPTALATAVNSWANGKVIAGTAVTKTAEKFKQGQTNPAPITIVSGEVSITTPGLYKFTMQAFYRMRDNATNYTLHTQGWDQPAAYVYFGDAKTQVASVFDSSNTSSDGCYTGADGKYYPNGQNAAKTAFQAGNYINTVWKYVTQAEIDAANGKFEYGLKYQGWPNWGEWENGSQKIKVDQWSCWAIESVELTLYAENNADYVKDGVRHYIGTYASAPEIELTDDVPVANTTAATFSSGTSTVNFTNPNGLIFANSGQINSDKNVVAGTTCANLQLEKGHPFINPKEFTATSAKYTMVSGELAGGNFATLMVPFTASLPSGGSAYKLDQELDLMDGTVRGTSTSIAANSPVLVTAAGNYTGSNVTVPVVASGATFESGELVGTYSPMTAVEGSYVLQNHTSGEGVAFYLVGSSNKPTVNPFRAYIKPQGSNARALKVVFDDAQGISTTLNDNGQMAYDIVYDLQGRRVAQPTKGLYIVNGRKTVIK